LHRALLLLRSDELVGAQSRVLRGHAAQRRLRDHRASGGGGVHLPAGGSTAGCRCGLSGAGKEMIEAVMIWNEPNNKSHWDPELDPDWARFAEMAILASRAIRRENPQLPIVLGGI